MDGWQELAEGCSRVVRIGPASISIRVSKSVQDYHRPEETEGQLPDASEEGTDTAAKEAARVNYAVGEKRKFERDQAKKEEYMIKQDQTSYGRTRDVSALRNSFCADNNLSPKHLQEIDSLPDGCFEQEQWVQKAYLKAVHVPEQQGNEPLIPGRLMQP